MKATLLRISLLASLCFSHFSIAILVVRMEFQQNISIDNVDLKLFNDDTPLTVANFLDYTNGTLAVTGTSAGNYLNSFVHRSAPNFVIQGEGFTF